MSESTLVPGSLARYKSCSFNCAPTNTHTNTQTVLGLCPVATSDCCHTSGDMWMDKVTCHSPSSSSPFLPMPPPPPPLSFHFLQLPFYLFKHWKESVLIYMGASCLKLPPRPCDSQLFFFFPPTKKRTKVSEWMNECPALLETQCFLKNSNCNLMS